MELLGGDPAAAVGAKVVLGPGTGLGVGALIQTGGHLRAGSGRRRARGARARPGGRVPDLGEHRAGGRAHFRRGTAERPRPRPALPGRGPNGRGRRIACLAGRDHRRRSWPAPTRPRRGPCRSIAACSVASRATWRSSSWPAGGAYIGGGISPRILPFLQEGEFRRASRPRRRTRKSCQLFRAGSSPATTPRSRASRRSPATRRGSG
jgi:hypothetical protein